MIADEILYNTAHQRQRAIRFFDREGSIHARTLAWWGARVKTAHSLPPFLFRDPLRQPALTALLRRIVSPDLIGCFGSQRGHRYRFAVSIDGDKGEIARVRVPSHAGQQILRFHPYPYFHGRAADVVDARFHDHKISDVDRLAEIDAIDRHRHPRHARLAS